MHWKTDAGLVARAYAWEGFHRGDPGRVIAGLDKGRITDDEDAMMLVDSLVTLGREDHAEVICLGCGGMAELEATVRERTGVPVVDGVSAAVTVAESLVHLGLSTSKVRTYAPARVKKMTGWPLSGGR